MTTITKTNEIAEAIAGCEEAVVLIDEKLSEFSPRTLVSSSEMCDLLLDIRNHIADVQKMGGYLQN